MKRVGHDNTVKDDAIKWQSMRHVGRHTLRTRNHAGPRDMKMREYGIDHDDLFCRDVVGQHPSAVPKPAAHIQNQIIWAQQARQCHQRLEGAGTKAVQQPVYENPTFQIVQHVFDGAASFTQTAPGAEQRGDLLCHLQTGPHPQQKLGQFALYSV